ncbi:MAG: S1C family serine protease [Dehalococcoidia bacterium]
MNETQNGALQELSDALAAAVDHASNYTVRVNARRRMPASGIAWTDGVILTADHVIERDEDISVTLADGTNLPATIAGRDPGSDLAVLRVQSGPAAAPRADGAKVGHLVLALGRPGDTGLTAAMGVISAIGGPWQSGRGSTVEGYIRADVTMYPGFSGGPLIDTAGRVIGINSSGISRTGGITIPAAAADSVVQALLAHGKMKRGFLGLTSQAVPLSAPLQETAGQETGLLVARVAAGTPAEQGGILIGDIIVGLGGHPVRDTDELQRLLSPDRVGQPTPLRIIRGGEIREVSVTVGERE